MASEKILIYFNPNIEHNIKVKHTPDGKKDIELVSQINVAHKGDVLAKLVPQDAPAEEGVFMEAQPSDFKPGINVNFDKDKRVYLATTYGFVVMINKAICVDVPLLINDIKTKAILLLHPNRSGLWPDLENIIDIINLEHLLQTVSIESIKSFLHKLSYGEPRLVKMMVARGVDPITGIKAYNKLLIDLNQKVGTMREDGSIDYHELDKFIRIKKGQVIGEAVQQVKAIPGLDVFGRDIPVDTIENTNYMFGKNITRKGNEFISEVEGVLLMDLRKVEVSELLYISGDVDFHQGNIEFSGTVQVAKSVLPGFSIKAGGDVIVEGHVDDAVIQAGGNVTVKKGIISQTGKTVIEAKGSVQSKYAMDALITAEKDIIIEEYASNCKLIAYESIALTSKKGQLIGGDATAKFKVEAINLGSVAENPTKITVGKDQTIETELKSIMKELDESSQEYKELVKEIKANWSEKFFENPEEYLKNLKQEKLPEFVPIFKRYSLLKSNIDKLENRRHELTIEKRFDPPPKIIVHNTTFGGVTMQIYNILKKIDVPFTACYFKEEGGEIVSHPVA